jgi:thymidylate synthase (FAD)
MEKEQYRVERLQVPALDEILGIPFRVLDEGFVRVIDYMGSDESIVQAARVSYGKGTQKVHEDRGLIRYLIRHRHTTPFEMCGIKLHLRVPMDCWRQWIRHRTASINEYSTRYSVAIDASQRTAPGQWRFQSVSNRQGSQGFLDPARGEALSRQEAELQDSCRRIYHERLEAGVAREQARKDLPLSTYTEAYWKCDLHNLLHFLVLRTDMSAQSEIREYAKVIADEVLRRWCPIVYEAFRDYYLNSLPLTRLDQAIIRELGAGRLEEAARLAREFGILSIGPDGPTRNRERQELEAKLLALNLPIPWLPPSSNGAKQPG